jgi:predicted CopG family antitoxin
MVVKTITVTKRAYDALKAMKSTSESFSEAILRISNRRRIWDFFGSISHETADKMELAINEARKIHRIAHKKRMNKLISEFRR